MIVSALELFHVAVSDSGRERNSPIAAPREAVLVRIFAHDENAIGGATDLEGWGEATADAAPTASEEWAGGAYAFLARHLAPLVIAEQITAPTELAAVTAKFRSQSAAKCAFDVALYDLAAKASGEPLWKLLGGADAPINLHRALGGHDSVDELIAQLERQSALGQSAFTLQLAPGWGIEVVRAVRAMFPAVSLRVDFNGTATLDQRDLLFRLQDFMLTAIEQPLEADDVVGHAMLQEAMRTPLALDQSIRSLGRAQTAIDLGACREIRVRPEQVGGLTAALQIASLCAEQAVAMRVGSGAATQIGLRQAIALAAATSGTGYGQVELEPHAANFAAMDNELWAQAGLGDSRAVLDGVTILASQRFDC
jgi:O-succinylbenzoate synthase